MLSFNLSVANIALWQKNINTPIFQSAMRLGETFQFQNNDKRTYTANTVGACIGISIA